MNLIKHRKSIILLGILFAQLLIIAGLKMYSDYSTVESVKSRIEKAYPQIKNPAISDIEKTNLLREWTSSQVVWGSDSTNINHLFPDKSLPEMFETFDRAEGSVDCGIVSYVLMKVYEAYGYESYTYHSGSLDGFNHAITLVRVQSNNKKILMIQDASFDLSYLDKNGNPYDFFDFIKTIKNSRSNDIIISQGNGKPHYYLCYKYEKCNKPLINNLIIPVSKDKSKYLEKFTTNRIRENMHIYLVNRGIFSHAEGQNTEVIKKQLSAILN
jgi:hypothetical protein